MGNIFNDDFQDFITALQNQNVEYMLVGGYSVILHGYSRTTGDMDIWVNRTEQNYQKIVASFRQFGMPVYEMTEANFLNHPTWDVFRFGRNPTAIDIMTRVKGLEFVKCYAASEVREIEGMKIRVIHYNDLIAAKKAAGRNKDLGDLDALENNSN